MKTAIIKRVTATDFVSKYKRVMNDHSKELLPCWKRNSLFNEIMLGKRYGISLLSEVCKALRRPGLNSFTEFTTLDMIYYVRPESSFSKHKENWYADTTLVAIEHENGFEDSLWEMNKLCQLNAPLSVLITYPDDREKTYLDKFSEICRLTDVNKSFGKIHEKLVIFGYGKDASWRFFKFDGMSFVRLHR